MIGLVTLSLVLSGYGAVASHPDAALGSPAQPETAEKDPAAAYAAARVATMTLQQKVASLLMLHKSGTDADALRAFIDASGLGGLIFMGDNVPGTMAQLRAQTQALASDPGLPPLTAIDQEGGVVRRIAADDGPGAAQLKHMPPAATRDAFAARAALVRSAGIDINFGIVADVTSDPRSFIYDRVLGGDAAQSAARVAQAVAGEKGAVLSTLKHFPGHGEVEADSHHGVPVTPLSMGEWRRRDAPSFKAGISAGAEVVMFGHLVYSAVDRAPASLSARWHSILSDELGFSGITITDDLRMLRDSGLSEYRDPVETAIRAIAAGNTMLLYVLGDSPAQDGVDAPALVTGITAAVTSGRIPLSLIDADATKLLQLRRSLSGYTGPYQHCDAHCRATLR